MRHDFHYRSTQYILGLHTGVIAIPGRRSCEILEMGYICPLLVGALKRNGQGSCYTHAATKSSEPYAVWSSPSGLILSTDAVHLDSSIYCPNVFADGLRQYVDETSCSARKRNQVTWIEDTIFYWVFGVGIAEKEDRNLEGTTHPHYPVVGIASRVWE